MIDKILQSENYTAFRLQSYEYTCLFNGEGLSASNSQWQLWLGGRTLLLWSTFELNLTKDIQFKLDGSWELPLTCFFDETRGQRFKDVFCSYIICVI